MKKSRDILSFVLMFALAMSTYGCDKAFESTADQPVTEVAFAAEEDTVTFLFDPTGTWNKTGCLSQNCATVIITDAGSEGFNFSASFSTYAKYTELEGWASFISDTVAVWPQDDADDVSTPAGHVYFEFDGDMMHVTSDGNLGTGSGPFVSGDFTLDDPRYINDEYVSGSFYEEELELIRNILTDDEYCIFMDDAYNTVLLSSDVVLSDGRGGRLIEAFVPGDATSRGFTVLFAGDGTVYYQNLDGTFRSSDTEYTEGSVPSYERN